MQKVTVTFETEDGVDAEKLVRGLATAGNGLRVVVQPVQYAAAQNITFVSTEQVEEPAS